MPGKRKSVLDPAVIEARREAALEEADTATEYERQHSLTRYWLNRDRERARYDEWQARNRERRARYWREWSKTRKDPRRNPTVTERDRQARDEDPELPEGFDGSPGLTWQAIRAACGKLAIGLHSPENAGAITVYTWEADLRWTPAVRPKEWYAAVRRELEGLRSAKRLHRFMKMGGFKWVPPA